MAPGVESDDDQAAPDSPARSRGRRERSKKVQSRSSALERLKAAKSGDKEAKYACAKEDDAVYEYVDEDEYSSRVRNRQQDDWIVDDDGMGYAETGFEIFDEEGEDEENADKKPGKKGEKGKDANKKNNASSASSETKHKNPDIKDPNKPEKKPASLKAMFSAQAASNKKTGPKESGSGSVNEDSVLKDIMAELKQEPVLLAKAPQKRNTGLPAESKTNPFSVRASSPAPLIIPVDTPAPRVNAHKPTTVNNNSNNLKSNAKPTPVNNSSVSNNKPTPVSNNKPTPVAKPVIKSTGNVVRGEEKMAPSQFDSTQVTELSGSTSGNVVSSSKSRVSQPETPLVKSAADDAIDAAMMVDDDMEEDPFVEEDPFEEEMKSAVKQEIKREPEIKSEPVVEVKQEKRKIAPSLNQITETGWDADEGDISCSAVPSSSSSSSSSSLPLTEVDGEQVFRFYWLDAYEDIYKQPGTIYLFGKVASNPSSSSSSFVSACVVVKDVERLVYFLPRRHRCDPKSGRRFYEEGEEGDQVSFQDVYMEVNKLAGQREILKFKSKKVEKKYAFGTISAAPHEGEYLQVMYSAKYSPFPSDLKGETFSHVFGANTSFLENFLIQRKIKGPCWLDVKGAVSSSPKVSWCQVEASSSSPLDVYAAKGDSLPPPPPLVVMSLSLRTVQSTKTNQNEVILITALVNHNYRFDKPAPLRKWETHVAGISKPSDEIFPFDFADAVAKSRNRFSCDIVANERGLLGLFLAKLCKIDPDILVGHDLLGLDFDILLARISANKVPLWSRLGRLKRTTMPRLGLGFGGKVNADAKLAAAGRLVVDTEISAKELIRCKSYDLSTLVNIILKPPVDRRHHRLDEESIRGAYQSSSDLVKLIEMTLTDANYVLALMFELNIVPLAHQITCICGNSMSKTLSGGRAERNTFLLLHAFNEKGYICPDKEYGGKKKGGGGGATQRKIDATQTEGEDADSTVSSAAPKSSSAASRKKPQYAGGLVLEPKKGFYDKFVLLLDFNSLYPSIIQEYNICFTTIDLREHLQLQTEDPDSSDALPAIPDGSLEAGVLPTEIRRLVESRRSVKQLLKTVEPGSDAYCQYDIRQKALKLTANSMYGCLGFTESRFHATPLAALVTAKGRESLMKTKELALGMGLDVIYGDTDSIMINTNSTDIEAVFKLGQKVKAEVNKLYKLLEIDIDGIFKSMLLLKKKKYAALTMSKGMNGEWITTEELKGLDIVRRDWCDLAKTIGHSAVSEILSGKSREEIVPRIHEYLVALETRVRTDVEPLESYVIQKQLVKHPEEYPDKKSLPHVQVALRNNSRGGKKCKAGDTVPYIICLDGSNSSAAQRAYHPEELAKMDNLTVDKPYYMTSQVHPVVSRLCDPIEGLDAAAIAAALGLKPENYVKRNKEEQTEEEAMMAGDTFQEALARFKDCDRFKIPCKKCGKEHIWDSVFVDADGKSATPTLAAKCGGNCGGADFVDSVASIKNKLAFDIRQHIKSYYASWLKCEDDACAFRTRRTPLASVKGGAPRCPACGVGALQPEMAASKLHDQLLFYRFIFDWDKGLLGLNPAELLSVGRHAGAEDLIRCYALLKSHVDKVLADSAYDQVDLTQFARLWC